MLYRIIIDGQVWASGLTAEAAEVVERENRELRPGLDIKVEAVAR